MATFGAFRDGGSTDEKGIAYHISKLFNGQVINGLAVTQQSPLALGITISAGTAMVPSSSDYNYLPWSNATANITLDTADGSNPRIDLIIAYFDLSVVQDVTPNNPNTLVFAKVTGTPSGSPSVPSGGTITAVTESNPYITLASVLVNAGVTTVTNSNITDLRTLATLSTPVSDASVTNAKLAAGAGQPGGAWTSWTPTWTNITVGSGTVVAKYSQIGKTVVARISFIYGSGSAVGTAVTFTLPVTAVSYPNIANDMDIIGSGHMLDSGSGNYDAVVGIATTTTARIYSKKADATHVYTTDLTSTVPFTWAANDTITLLLTYEAA